VTDSWWLKLDRAEHHLKEVNDYIAAYSKPHPYEALRGANLRVKGKKTVRYSLHFTSEPDERLSVVVGDVVHNVRSALDHVVTNMAPNSELRSKIAFCIFTTRPYDDDGEPLDSEDGKRWASLRLAVPAKALAQIDYIQPYRPPPESVVTFCRENGLDPADVHGIAILNKLDNADKHRRLIPVAQGLGDAVVTITPPNGESISYPLPGMVMDGAVIASYEVTDPSREAEVDVYVNGTPQIAIEVEKEKGAIRIPGALEKMIAHARELTGRLAPFVSTAG